MARLDVYRPANAPGYLLDCQADVLSDLNTRFIVPLLPPAYGPPIVKRLNPTFSIAEDTIVMYTQ